LYGFENISANNGWAISFLGITIVFCGLTLLSLIISQLYKVLDFWENRNKPAAIAVKKEASLPAVAPTIEKMRLDQLPDKQQEIARQFKLLVDRLEKPLSLPALLSLAVMVGIESPHSNLNDLLRRKVIVPDGKGYFNWNA
jgi:Na+-transporting methylmalonyl-CoA/oxaloacetate decarboxylase gamma subunit